MKFDDVILGRRSIRGYLAKPVPRALIEEILTLAMRAPSSMNTQPWHFHIITGEPLDRIRRGNTDNILAFSIGRVGTNSSLFANALCRSNMIAQF